MENSFRKKWYYRGIFLIAGLLIIGVSLFLAFRGQDNWTGESYGTTTDGKVSVTDEDLIRVSFRISADHFRGVSLKLTNETKKYVNEELEIWIEDQDTKEILAEGELKLKEAFGQSPFFIPLPIEESENRQVVLYIKGKNIITVPDLCVSEKYDQESLLYINGNVEKNKYLVFSAEYHEKTKINISVLIKGVIYLLILILVYFWQGFFSGTEKDLRISDNKIPSIFAWLWKVRKIWIFGILTLLYAVLFYFVYANNIKPVRQKRDDIVIGEDEKETFTLTQKNERIEWEITAEKKNLSALMFKSSVENRDENAGIRILVYDDAYSICYLDKTCPVKTLPEDTGWWTVYLRKMYTDCQGENFHIIMEPVNFGETVVRFIAGSTADSVDFRRDGEELNIVPTTLISYSNRDYLKTLYIIFAALTYGFMLMSYFLIVILRVSVEKAYVPVLLYLGILYMLVIPVYSVPDEYTHIDSAYIVSNYILGAGEPEEYGYGYKRAADIETEEYFTYYTTLADYRRLYIELFESPENTELAKCKMRSGLGNANVLYYLPAAIGISIGRMAGCGTLMLFLLGRFMNLLAFVLLTYLALRKMPGFQSFFMVFAALPVMLQEAASFSYDCILNAFAILFIAYCLFFASCRQQEVKLRDVFMLLFLLVQVASVKGGVYLPLCITVCIIFTERKWKLRHAWGYMLLAAGTAFLAFLQNNASRLIKSYFFASRTRINPFVGSELYTIGDIISSPKKIIRVFINTFFQEGSRVIYEILGGKMGSLKDIQMPWLYEIIFLLIILYLLRQNVYRLKMKASMIITLLGSAGTVLLLGISMLIADTARKYDYIVGLQGRYYYPCIFAALMICGMLMKKRTEESSGEGVLAVYYVTHVVFLFHILMIVFS